MTTEPFDESMSVADAKAWLRGVVDEGVRCPCCTQFAKVYCRKLNSGMAFALIRAYRVAGTTPFHKPSVLRGVGAAARDESLLRWWGLMEPQVDARGKPINGWWQITEQGEAFVQERATVQRNANMYDGRCLGLSGAPITIREALGDKFDYDELMQTPGGGNQPPIP